MNIALGLTFGRILLSPVFLVLYLYSVPLGISELALAITLIVIVLLAELSDMFDGMAARKRGEVTELGKLLDPMADSIFRLSVFFCFTQGIIALPIWVVLLFFYRDSIISLLRTVCALRGFTLAARMSGKVKAVIQGTCVFVILILMIVYAQGAMSVETLQGTSFYLVLAAAVYSLVSGVEYLVANREYIKRALAK